VKAQDQRPEDTSASGDGTIADPGSLRPGERVVYPNQGVCQVVGVETQEIAGQRLELLRMVREEDGAAVLVPRGKVAAVGLRRVASRDYVEGVFHFLAAQAENPELDWKIRHRDNADRLVVGGVLGVAEVVKGLHALSHIRPLPTKEREQYDGARHLLVAEVAAALGVPEGLAEDYVDHALLPPAGTRFQLRPPPKPVVLPLRPRHRPERRADVELDLDTLGLELELPEAAVAAVGAEGEVAPAEEGALAEGVEQAPEEEAAGAGPAEKETARERVKGKGRGKAGERVKARAPARKGKAPPKKAARQAPKKAPKPRKGAKR
jgi:RNA polymerase-interacting CarD/CdnL/TRCF family regulator